MLRERTLFRGSIVDVTDVRCRVTSAQCGCEEHSPTNCIVLPRRGAYVRHLGKQQTIADPTRALFFNAGESYRISHPVGLGDDCTAITFDERTLLDVIDQRSRSVPRREQPFAMPEVMLTSRTILLGHALFRLSSQANAGPILIEETSLELLSSILADAARDRTRQAGDGQPTAKHRDLLDAVRLAILANPGGRLTLMQLAQRVGCSPFHLTRICRQLTGVPLHQYLLKIRLALALSRLQAGTALSPLAFELGFSSHSHFSAMFRRAYGVSPSSIASPV